MRNVLKSLALAAFLATAVISGGVELEVSSPPIIRGPKSGPHAVVIHHPNVFDDFIGSMVDVFEEELVTSGWRVTHELAGDREIESIGDASLVVFGANTFWFHPDFPTLATIDRNARQLQGKQVFAFIGGAGATGRSERVLETRLRATGAQSVTIRSLWILRPNDDRRPDESNREVAKEVVRTIARTLTSTTG